MFTKSPKFDTLVKGITALPVRNTNPVSAFPVIKYVRNLRATDNASEYLHRGEFYNYGKKDSHRHLRLR